VIKKVESEMSLVGGGGGFGVWYGSHHDVIHPQAFQVIKKVESEMSLVGGTLGTIYLWNPGPPRRTMPGYAELTSVIRFVSVIISMVD